MTPHHLESRLRRELRTIRPQPSSALRGRILAALDEVAPQASSAPAPRTVRNLTFQFAALAASLLFVICVRTATSTATPPPASAAAFASAEPALAWSASLNDSAVDWKLGLLAQGDVLAADARRAAGALLDRLPAAPWAKAKRTDGDR